MRVRYRGLGTGLRLEAPDNNARTIDVGGSAAKGAPMTIYVGDGDGRGAQIDLYAGDVALLIEQCASYLARVHDVPNARA